MKLVLLMYLKDDEKCVARLLKDKAIDTYSRLPLEGHGPGSASGWSGEIQPYESQLVMSVLPDEQAAALLDAISQCTGVQDPRHPIRAALLDVERFTCCEIGQP